MSNDGASASMDDEQVWYFGYGSNMKLSVMKSRGIAFLDAQAVSVPGYMLTFDVFGLPYSEPSMASVAPHESRSAVGQSKLKEPPPVHGIAYLLSFPDFRRVVGSEGGGVAYREIRVTGVKCNDATAENITMTTLTAKYPRRPNAAPSLRYVTLLREGAEEQGLPASYQEYLNSLPAFEAGETWRNRLGASTFLWFGRRIVRTLARRVRNATNADGQCPEWYGNLIRVVYNSMWLWHDYVHAPIFGRGDGGGMSQVGL